MKLRAYKIKTSPQKHPSQTCKITDHNERDDPMTFMPTLDPHNFDYQDLISAFIELSSLRKFIPTHIEAHQKNLDLTRNLIKTRYPKSKTDLFGLKLIKNNSIPLDEIRVSSRPRCKIDNQAIIAIQKSPR